MAPPGTYPFESETEERLMWERHRAELLAECQPGRRPAAFWRFDLRVTPPSSWPAELGLLVAHELVTPEEMIAIEASNPLLDSRQSPQFNSSFESPDAIRRLHGDPGTLKIMHAEFRFAAEWHQRRGRPKLAESYALRARTVQEFLESA